MTHKNSILICQMSDESLDFYVNGTQVLKGSELVVPLNRIANSKLKLEDITKFFAAVIQSLEISSTPKLVDSSTTASSR